MLLMGRLILSERYRLKCSRSLHETVPETSKTDLHGLSNKVFYVSLNFQKISHLVINLKSFSNCDADILNRRVCYIFRERIVRSQLWYHLINNYSWSTPSNEMILEIVQRPKHICRMDSKSE
jgi:hypothetical protein